MYVVATPSQRQRARSLRLSGFPRRVSPRLAGDCPAGEALDIWQNCEPVVPYTPSPSMPPPDPSAITTISSVSDLFYNAVTGNLDTNQVNALKAQQAAAMVRAGANPGDAATQANDDVNAALANVTAPGAFGITWTGALPSSPTWYSTLFDSLDPLNPANVVPWWVWAALGLGGFLLLKDAL